jgi:hypothetical protein
MARGLRRPARIPDRTATGRCYGLAARYEYQAELVLLRRLAEDRPADAGLLRDLAGVHRSLAGWAERDGDRAAAQREQAAEVAVLRQLALADPATAPGRRPWPAATAGWRTWPSRPAIWRRLVPLCGPR